MYAPTGIEPVTFGLVLPYQSAELQSTFLKRDKAFILQQEPLDSRIRYLHFLATTNDVYILHQILSDESMGPAAVEIDSEVYFVNVLGCVLVERARVEASLQLIRIRGHLLFSADMLWSCGSPHHNLVVFYMSLKLSRLNSLHHVIPMSSKLFELYGTFRLVMRFSERRRKSGGSDLITASLNRSNLSNSSS